MTTAPTFPEPDPRGNNRPNGVDDRLENSRFEDDLLWPLLGELAPVSPSPFFTRRVLQAIDPAASAAKRFDPWRFLPPSGLAVAAAVAFAATLRLPVHAVTPLEGESMISVCKPGDAEVVRHLDELLAQDENTVWLSAPSL